MEHKWYIPNILKQESSPFARIILENRSEISFHEEPLDIEALTSLSSEELIDRFLSGGGDKRIVAEQGEASDAIIISPELSDEEDIVSEELANIYLMQGLKEEAIEIYSKLSLLNSEKSVYFAELIAKAKEGQK